MGYCIDGFTRRGKCIFFKSVFLPALDPKLTDGWEALGLHWVKKAYSHYKCENCNNQAPEITNAWIPRLPVMQYRATEADARKKVEKHFADDLQDVSWLIKMIYFSGIFN